VRKEEKRTDIFRKHVSSVTEIDQQETWVFLAWNWTNTEPTGWSLWWKDKRGNE